MKRKKMINPYWNKLWKMSRWYWGILMCSILFTFVYIIITEVLELDVSTGWLGYILMFCTVPGAVALLGLIPYILLVISTIRKARSWHEPPVKETKKDVLTLLRYPPSHGDMMVDTLELMEKDGKPTLLWCVSWRGGYDHADGAGDYLPIPESVLKGMTAASLVDWISVQNFMVQDTDLSQFKTDTRVIDWCSAHRLEGKVSS